MNRTIARTLSFFGLAIAVFVVGFAGSATAAKLITGKDIKDNTVATADVKNGTITGMDVKKGAVAEKKLSAGVQTKLNEDALAGYEVVSGSVDVPTAGTDTVFLFCPAGKLAISGGGSWTSTDTSEAIAESQPGKAIGEFFADLEPGDEADAWKITGNHNSLDPVTLTGYVICVSAS